VLPASTQARALLLLRRPAEAARIASRLLSASAADPLVVDGLLAGAEGALAVGDRGLATRLLRHALRPENADAARRAAAERLLRAAAADAPAAKAKAEAAPPPR
jgi:hypothetical protein